MQHLRKETRSRRRCALQTRAAHTTRPTPPHRRPLQANLKRVHTLYCQWEDHSNTEFMSQAKWRVFEKDFRVEPTEPHDFFAQFAKVQGPKKEPTLSPVDFTSAVVQYLLWQHDDPQPLPHLQRLLGGGAVSLGGGAAAGAEECEELVAMRYEIEQTAGRLCRRFDVYRGPILVGTVEDRGGWVAYADAPRFAHEFLTYEVRTCPVAQGCVGTNGTSAAAPEAVRQAVGGGCQSG